MLAVLEVARSVFWNDSMFNRELMPSEASLERCRLTLVDLSTMTGRERIATFQQCGIDPSLYPLFLRALQHITAIYSSGNYADDSYLLHRRLSPKYWSAQAYTAPLVGYPSVNSTPYRDQCPPPVVVESKPADTVPTFRSTCSSDIHYNGLLNQGATCYLNSLLQALFHISAFRSIIYRMPTKEEADMLAGGDVVAAKSIPYALQRLFCLLQTGSKPMGTKELTESFGWSSADSFIQHDVHEMTRVLLDKLEETLNVQRAQTRDNPDITKGENEIHKLFHGSLESYVKVDEADYYGAREEPFYDIQLVVKNKRNIYESFDAMFQVEVLDGKNKYCLEQNGTKTYHRAEKGVQLKETPPVLLLHLTRYDYNIEVGETKVSTRWDYYNTLDLSRYMPHVPVEYSQYTLCSVLVHSGSNAGFGHYFCFLRCSGSWYKFNDETVSPASLKDVFGANFGGFRTNYWGTQVPHTASAYMLVYVRTNQIPTILRRIDGSDVPVHVIDQLRKEEAEHERLMREMAEDHLYGRVHFIQPPEILEQEEYLCSKRPVSQKFPPHRTLRVLLENEALPDFTQFVSKQLGISAPEQAMWFASRRERGDEVRLFAQVKPGMKVSDVLEGSKECCVLVTTSANVPWLNCSSKPDAELQIYHHKFYDPLELKVCVLGSTVVRRDPHEAATEVLKQVDTCVRTMVSHLPDDTRKLRGHHLQVKLAKASASAVDLQKMADPSASPDDTGAEKACTREYPSCHMTCLLEEEQQTFCPCTDLRSGDIIVWQLQTDPQNQANVFYHNIESFQHFLRHRIPVEIRLNLPPKYPSLITTELAEDMTYEQLQRFVAFLIGESANYDRVRFTRHNPETELPYFMKGKKKDRPTLVKLLTPSTSRITTLSKFLYYEFCKFTVTEIECAHSLQFKLYNSSVKAVSPHWIIMPREVPITAKELFTTCIREIQQDIITGEVHPRGLSDSADPNAAQHPTPTDDIVRLIMDANEETWRSLRLVDVWRGRVYNILDAEHDLSFENQTFEESAEYRIEQVPLPLPGVSPEDQNLYQIQHFTMVRQRRDAVETHSEPFSMFVDHNELPQTLLRRIADKLGLSYVAVQDWKMCLVQEHQVSEVDANTPMGKQIMEFRHYESFCPNKEPQKMAFIGLEHAPVAKRTAKHADKVVILN